MSSFGLDDLDALRSTLASSRGAERLTPVGLGGVVLGDGGLRTLPALATELRRDGTGETAVLMDRRPMAGPGGAELKQSIAELLGESGPGRRIELGGAAADVHADPDTLEAAVAGVRGAALLVTVGSGTVTDIGKYSSH